MTVFGKRLTDLRKERDLSQTDIAGYLGMSRSGIQGYETEGKEPNYDTLCRIADYFDVSIDYLLGRSNERRRPPRKPGPMTYIVRVSCLQYGDVRVKANDPDEAKRKAELVAQSDAMRWFDSEITDMTAEEEPDEERTFTVFQFFFQLRRGKGIQPALQTDGQESARNNLIVCPSKYTVLSGL